MTNLETLNSPHSRARYAAVYRDFDGELTVAGIQSYIAAYRDQGAAPSTCNVKLSALKFRARAEGADPAIQYMKAISVRGVRMGTWLSLEQVSELLAPGGEDLVQTRDRCLLALLAGCALRRSELSDLKFAHLQSLDGRLVLLDLVGKGRRVRTVPVPSWAILPLNCWIEAAGISTGPVIRRVWRGRAADEGLTPDHIHAVVKAAGKRIGVPQLAPHDLRRTFARLAMKGKADLTQIQLTLGHSSVAVTNRYLHSTVDLENPACDAIKL
jgi:integrase